MGPVMVGVTIACSVAVLALVLRTELRLRKSGVHQAVSETWRTLARVQNWVEQAEDGLMLPERELLRQARQYVDWHFDEWMKSLPVEALRQHGANRVRWSALRTVGIRTMMDLAQKHDRLGDADELPGISPEGVRRLSQAAQEFLHTEMKAWRPPIPAPGPKESVDTWVVGSALQVHRVRQRVTYPFGQLRTRLEELSNKASRTVGPTSSRWRFFISRGTSGPDAIRRAHEIRKESDTLLNADIPKLGEIIRSCGAGPPEDGYLNEYQQHFDALLDVIEEFIVRAFDGGLEGWRSPPTFGERVWPTYLRDGHVAATLSRVSDERTFCDHLVQPLIRRIGYTALREVKQEVPVGSTTSVVYVDFALQDAEGRTAALLEAKASIRSDAHLDRACDQVVSYGVWNEVEALFVAAPEGLWLFKRDGIRCDLIERWSIEEAWNSPTEVRTKLEEAVRWRT